MDADRGAQGGALSRRRRNGILVAIEGVDGVGKSSLQRRLVRRLTAEGYKVSSWREPTDRSLGARAQETGQDRPWTAAMLFNLDRAIARPRLESRLASSDIVLSDRSFYSTLAYQGSALSPSGRRTLTDVTISVTRRPDLVLLIRLPLSVAWRRLDARGKRRTPLERKRTLARVARAYDRLARVHRWTSLDGRASATALADAAWSAVHHRLGPARAPGRR